MQTHAKTFILICNYCWCYNLPELGSYAPVWITVQTLIVLAQCVEFHSIFYVLDNYIIHLCSIILLPGKDLEIITFSPRDSVFQNLHHQNLHGFFLIIGLQGWNEPKTLVIFTPCAI